MASAAEVKLPTDRLRGAYLEVAEERSDANGIRQLYESDNSRPCVCCLGVRFLEPDSSSGCTISHATSLMWVNDRHAPPPDDDLRVANSAIRWQK